MSDKPTIEELEAILDGKEVKIEILPTGEIKEVEKRKNEKTLRYWLWLKHGHTELYGDDGEMQCQRCMLDFKRDSVERISEVFNAQAEKAMIEGWKKDKGNEIPASTA